MNCVHRLLLAAATVLSIGCGDDGSSPGVDAGLVDAGRRDAGRIDGGTVDGGDDDGGPVGTDAGVTMDAGLDGGSQDGGPSCVDSDGDGAGVGDGCAIEDCDDDDSASFPGALEVCDLTDNDCDGVDDEGCICPLLTEPCATGCCELGTERVSRYEGAHPDAALDADGNLFIAFADPDSLGWRSALAIRAVDEGAFRQVDYGGGSRRSEVRVSASGRVFHLHARYSGPVSLHYSDDQGTSWTEIEGIPGPLRIGGGCSLDLDAAGLPHLYCGFEESIAFRSYPTHLRWDGSTWLAERLETTAGGARTTQLHLDSSGRPQVIHTYGPTTARLHHTRMDGSDWVTEAVPYPAALQLNGDRHVGFAIDASDGLHVAFSARMGSGSDYGGWYGYRSPTGAWTFEEVVPPASVGRDALGVHLALQSSGEPVLAVQNGAMARRTAAGTWVLLTSVHPVEDLLVDGTRALVFFQADEGLASPLRVASVDLFP